MAYQSDLPACPHIEAYFATDIPLRVWTKECQREQDAFCAVLERHNAADDKLIAEFKGEEWVKKHLGRGRPDNKVA